MPLQTQKQTSLRQLPLVAKTASGNRVLLDVAQLDAGSRCVDSPDAAHRNEIFKRVGRFGKGDLEHPNPLILVENQTRDPAKADAERVIRGVAPDSKRSVVTRKVNQRPGHRSHQEENERRQSRTIYFMPTPPVRQLPEQRHRASKRPVVHAQSIEIYAARPALGIN